MTGFRHTVAVGKYQGHDAGVCWRCLPWLAVCAGTADVVPSCCVVLSSANRRNHRCRGDSPLQQGQSAVGSTLLSPSSAVPGLELQGVAGRLRHLWFSQIFFSSKEYDEILIGCQFDNALYIYLSKQMIYFGIVFCLFSRFIVLNLLVLCLIFPL